MSETLATVLKIAVSAVLIVALIAVGKWAIDGMSARSKEVTNADGGTADTEAIK